MELTLNLQDEKSDFVIVYLLFTYIYFYNIIKLKVL